MHATRGRFLVHTCRIKMVRVITRNPQHLRQVQFARRKKKQQQQQKRMLNYLISQITKQHAHAIISLNDQENSRWLTI